MAVNYIILGILLIFTTIHFTRRYLLSVEQSPKNNESFNGQLYSVGDASVACRKTRSTPKFTVIAMPGFLEDQRYFYDLYKDDDIELILLNSSNYHVPVIPCQLEKCDFSNTNKYEPDSIEYDAAVLNWATRNLASTNQIRLHGHSRGGAVVLEAVKQAPELHENSEVLIEAPVLPQGKGYPALEIAFGKVGLYLLPLFIPIIKRIPANLYISVLYRPLNKRKESLLSGLFYSPKYYQTIINNIYTLERWMNENDFSIYDNVTKGYILIGEKDTVLDRKSMLESAHHAHSLKVIETHKTSHFVSLDNPDVVPPVGSAEILNYKAVSNRK